MTRRENVHARTAVVVEDEDGSPHAQGVWQI
jgi:hypothetical protein